MARLDEFLIAEEYDILEEIDDELRDLSPPSTVRERLIQLGYVHETMQGLRITPAGRMRLALGK